MLAYYVEWHMRQALAPLLFDDEEKAAAEALRASVVAPAQPSAKARRKASRQRTDEGAPVHSFQTLFADLATIVKTECGDSVPRSMHAREQPYARRTPGVNDIHPLPR